jgi:hypothetical protein
LIRRARRPRRPLVPTAVATVVAAALVALLPTPRAAAAQRVLLQIRPQAGDTLHMRFDQQVDVAGTTHQTPADSATIMSTTSLFVLARTIVERTDSTGSDVSAVTDSVAVATVGGRGSESAERARRDLQGKLVRMHVALDGATVVRDPAGDASSELRQVLADVPATLPREPIMVGHTWQRTMETPLGGAYGGRGQITAHFRLDSVSRGGDSAFVSVRGAMGSARPAAGANTITVTMSGAMLIDLRRGWLSDMHVIITVHSMVLPAREGDPPPLRMRMTVTQWLRTVDRP